jgi:hypothetical protein
MRYATAFLFAAFFVVIPSIAQSKIEVDDLAHHPFEADFPSGGQLSLHIRSAEIHIVGRRKQNSRSREQKGRRQLY